MIPAADIISIFLKQRIYAAHQILYQKRETSSTYVSLQISAGDRDRTSPTLVSLDGKELRGLTFYSEPTSEPSVPTHS